VIFFILIRINNVKEYSQIKFKEINLLSSGFKNSNHK